MKSSISHDCTIVVSTCDNYSDIWEPFFTLFNKYWPDNPYPVYINSETFDCSNDKVAVTTLKARSADLSWTRRLKEALERIKTEYVIFMLDDFFLYDYVNNVQIEECLSYMHKDPDIATIYFSPLSYQMQQCDLFGLEQCKHMCKSKVNLTLALWRRNTFLHYLDYDETAWEFEANSLERSVSRNDKFYSFSKSVSMVMPYDYTKYGLFAGKWFRTTTDLFKKHEIKYDFSRRGFYEDYEVGLIPYVVSQIRMDSYLVPCYSLARENPRINAAEIVEEGYFYQRYDVSGAQYAAIWHPSSRYGYAIENFKCKIVFESGAVKTMGAEDVYGSFALYHNAMYFLKWERFVYILPDTKQAMSRIIIEGFMNKHLDRNDLITAYGMDIRVVPTSLGGLLNSSRIYAETLLIPETFEYFRVYSKLCLRYRGNYDVKNTLLDSQDRFPGSFQQTYKIDQSADNIVKWDLSGSFGGFALKDLKVEMVYTNCISQLLEPQKIEAEGCLLINGYWVLLSPSASLLFSLTEDLPNEIRISGDIMAPMPRGILKVAIYGGYAGDTINDNNGYHGRETETQNSLLNRNGIRFILSIIKRGVKKYGIFGVIKEAIKRKFHL